VEHVARVGGGRRCRYEAEQQDGAEVLSSHRGTSRDR
jgi:hypothetical protein